MAIKKRSKIMKQAEKIMKRRFTFLPVSIVWFFKIAFAVAGFTLWGWYFVAVVVAIYIGIEVLKIVFSCLVSLLVLAIIITLITVLIF